MFAVILITACTPNVQYKNAPSDPSVSITVDSSVLDIMENITPDTVFLIHTKSYDYIFSQNKTLVSRYKITNSIESFDALALVVIVGIILFGIGFFIGTYNK